MPVNVPHASLTLDVLALIFGLCFGSFLNVVALRSLSGESVWWPASKCPRCQHKLSPLDNIPVLSYAFLQGKCRYCRTPIHWQYPLVELITGLTFVAIERVFLEFPNSPFNSPYWNSLLAWFNPAFLELQDRVIPASFAARPEFESMIVPYIIGMLIFACTLIAVTITDFREKLIPHEITYPSMIVGIIFSAFIRHDALGAMAGIGASYILFDFIAFYGLKLYVAMHGGLIEEEPGRKRRLLRKLPPRTRRRLRRGLRWRVDLASIESENGNTEPLEVMGGGDAVLSAVMAAYLGWQLLVLALLIGFIAGTIMGLVLLISEMQKAKLLHKCGRSTLLFGSIGATVFGVLGSFFPTDDRVHIMATMGTLGAVAGGMLGVVSIGTQVSKPYPFGPALAAGGFIAMFLLPNWLAGQMILLPNYPSLH